MDFINPKTMNNSWDEAAVIYAMQAQGFVVSKSAVKNQPIYDLVVFLKGSIKRAAYIQKVSIGTLFHC